MFNWKTAEREAQGVGATENMQSAGGGLEWKAELLKGRWPGSKWAEGLLEAWETQLSVMREGCTESRPPFTPAKDGHTPSARQWVNG